MTDFGTDTSCTTTMRTGVLVSGPRLVAESFFRRFSTPKGVLDGGDDERDFGFDLADKCGHVSSQAEEKALPAQVEAEALKDERVESVDVNVSVVKLGPSVSWTITIDGHTGLGPFQLVLGVQDVTVQLLGITAASVS